VKSNAVFRRRRFDDRARQIQAGKSQLIRAEKRYFLWTMPDRKAALPFILSVVVD
jgi:hypothetical protein